MVSNITYSVGPYALNVTDNITMSTLCVDCGNIENPYLYFQFRLRDRVNIPIGKNSSCCEIANITDAMIGDFKALLMSAYNNKNAYPENVRKIVNGLTFVLDFFL